MMSEAELDNCYIEIQVESDSFTQKLFLEGAYQAPGKLPEQLDPNGKPFEYTNAVAAAGIFVGRMTEDLRQGGYFNNFVEDLIKSPVCVGQRKAEVTFTVREVGTDKARFRAKVTMHERVSLGYKVDVKYQYGVVRDV